MLIYVIKNKEIGLEAVMGKEQKHVARNRNLCHHVVPLLPNVTPSCLETKPIHNSGHTALKYRTQSEKTLA